MPNNINAAPTQSAIRRLHRDLRELKSTPLPNIAIQVGEDLFEWSVNLMAQEGPWAGIPVHLHVTFPQDYPCHAPRVDLITDLHGHPNVFGQYICLDMLKDTEYYAKPYQGWSAAYSACTLLSQLYGFLLVDDNIEQEYGGTQQRDTYGTRTQREHQARQVLDTCSCGFKHLPAAASTDAGGNITADISHGTDTAPLSGPTRADDSNSSSFSSGASSASSSTVTEPVAGIAATSNSDVLVALAGGTSLDLLDNHALRLMLANLGATDLWQCVGAGARLGHVARDVLQRLELVCYHSKAPYSETVLGFGVSRQWHASAGGSALKGLSSKTDYLALRSFREDGARKSAWNIPFDAFLPLYLNPEHGQRSLLQLPACIRGMLSRGCTDGCLAAAQGAGPLQQLVSTQEGARDLLQVLTMLINSLIVDVVAAGGMGGCSAGSTEGGAVGRSMSDAALQGFCHLHHLLLALALEPRSVLVQQARKDVRAFVGDEATRHKSRCPDLGLLLVKYMLVPREEVPWATFAPAFIRELLARQVRWVIQAAGSGTTLGEPYTEQIGASGESKADYDRLRLHFEHSLTGQRNVMLQAWFANALARPKSAASCVADLRAIKTAYDECSGLPPPRAFGSFNTHARAVMACGSWTQFLGHLRLGLLMDRHPRAQFVAMLRQAVLDSYHCGYHRAPNPFKGAPAATVEGNRAGRRAAPPCFLNWAKRPLSVISETWL